MKGVQLYTIVHFGEDIVRPKIGSIVSYVGGSTKLTSLRAHSSYKDFVTLLEETSKIRREDCKLYNFVHGCACVISSVLDFTVMINMHKTNPGTPFHIWIVNELRVPSQNSQNFISDFCSSGKGLSTTKDTGSGRSLSSTKARGPLGHNSFPDPEPKYRGYPETNVRGPDPCRFGPLVDDDDVPQSNNSFETIRTVVPYLLNEPVLTNVPQSNEYFQTIPTDVHLLNEPCISQSNLHLSNEPVLTNVHPSNEPMLTNVSLSIKPKPIIGQTEISAKFWLEPQPEQVKDLMDFWFKSAAYTENPYDYSKEFNIGDLYQDRIQLKNHIRAYVVVNKFNLEHVLSNEYKIVVCYKGHKCPWQIYATRLLGSALFRVSTYCSMHTCIRVETEGGNAYKAASSRWVASIIKQKLQKDPNYKPSRIIDDMQIHHNIDATYNPA
ncbi:hypothetical protein GIB67_013601 [Kingdonia uniflora]|uniref:Transposase MuDR plant domain-containing protein n=1 Tax=Kingdonia uniflora TaxID=39325 RepID=A0A7J7NPQ4_9MAGN|nr:hypothetical protein GIB67_013601 [Kingdonia uniflora]